MGIAEIESRLHELHARKRHIEDEMIKLRDELWDVENEIEFEGDALSALIEREEEREEEFYRLMREEED